MWPTYWCRKMYRWCLHGHTKNNPEIRIATLMITLFTSFISFSKLEFLSFYSSLQTFSFCCDLCANHLVSVNLDMTVPFTSTLSPQCPVVVTSRRHRLASVALWWVQSLNSIIFLWKFKTLPGSQEACLCFCQVPHWPPTHWKCLYMKEFMLSPAPE